MPLLWGLDCMNSSCRHPSVRGYRLHIELFRSDRCIRCGAEGKRLPAQWSPAKAASSAHAQDPYDRNERECCATRWTADVWMAERKDFFFRENELLSALDQMADLGVPGGRLDDIKAMIAAKRFSTFVITVEQPVLAYGGPFPAFPMRKIHLSAEAMPRSALYFRWNPKANEVLSEEKVFQAHFLAGSTAQERRYAPERRLSPEQFQRIFSRMTNDGSAYVQEWSGIYCQHCQQPLPLKAFNTSSLREVEKGE